MSFSSKFSAHETFTIKIYECLDNVERTAAESHNFFSDSKSLDTVSTKGLFTRNVCLSKMGSMVTTDGVHTKRLNCQEQGGKDETNT